MDINNSIVKAEPAACAIPSALPVEAMRAQINDIQNIMRSIMIKDEHYGTIPGTKGKPTLLKAGAEKLCFSFRLSPVFETIERDLGNWHREYRVTCVLSAIGSGHVLGTGLGMCSTMEAKYRWRSGERTCPKCGAAAIIAGKAEYGGGWLCFAKKGGCGAKFTSGSPEIESQPAGRVENTDIADAWNTVLKMAKKRAHVDACLTVLGASDIFTQDVEDFAVDAVIVEEPEPKPRPTREPRPEPAPPPPAPPGNGESALDARRRQTLLDAIKNQLVSRYPGQDADSKKSKTEALSLLFGTSKWAEVMAQPLVRLEAAMDDLRAPAA